MSKSRVLKALIFRLFMIKSDRRRFSAFLL